MAFTYSLADLADTTASGHNLAVVRRRLGDTVDTEAQPGLFQDEEIEYQLARYAGNDDATVGRALIALIHDTLSLIQREPDISADWLSVNWRRSSEYWRKLEDDVRREYGLESSVDATGFQVSRDDLTKGEDYFYYGNFRRLAGNSKRIVGRAQ